MRQRRTEKDELDDLGMELELVDEEERVLYRVGEAYVLLPHAEAIAQLEDDAARAAAQVDALQRVIDEHESEMSALKRVLYARFGNNINLER